MQTQKKTLQYFKIISEVGSSCTYRILVLKSLRKLINYYGAIYKGGGCMLIMRSRLMSIAFLVTFLAMKKLTPAWRRHFRFARTIYG